MEKLISQNTDILNGLASDLDALRKDLFDRIGENDAKYIINVARICRVFTVLGHCLIYVSIFYFPLFFVGVFLLALGKILDNMEIGHNVLHGQYDWMNHPIIHSKRYKWDIVCDENSWKHTHNFVHHTFTNVLFIDKDLTYGYFRFSKKIKWKKKHLLSPILFVLLSFLFQWGIGIHELTHELSKSKLKEDTKNENRKFRKDFLNKSFSQLIKDYLFFPLLAVPFGAKAFLIVFIGHLTANVLRNLWLSAVIFCGHFPEQAEVFHPDECENESRGHWYYRQILGSCNISGARWFHILSGHLSCQIEHHIFPDLPSSKYIEASKEVKEICLKYDIPYNIGSFPRQYGSVFSKLFRYSFSV